MKSLRIRLLSALMITIVLFWAGWGLFWTSFMWWEDKGWVDSMLRETAELVIYSLPENIELLDTPPVWRAAIPVPTSYKKDATVFQVWVGRRLAIRSPGAPNTPLRSNFTDGFSRESSDAGAFRVYALSDPLRHIQVQISRPISAGYQDLLSGLVSGVLNIALMFVLLGLAIWWVILKSFKPVHDVCVKLQDKPAFDFAPLPVHYLPKELRPLVLAFNRLLERLAHAVDAERRFIADAAHELRTPLAVMSVQAQVALNAPTVDEKDCALKQLIAGVDRGARLAGQLLDLARADASAGTDHYATTDISQLLDFLLNDFKFFASSKDQLISLSSEPCLVRCDINQMGTLIRNLLDNAIRFTQAQGRIDASCARVKIKGAGKIRLAISDNGPGIAQDQRNLIFKRFYRVADSEHHGSGIGLSLVERIAQSHGAEIIVGDGLDGRGLSVEIYFDEAD